jgi:OHCU decarboxylase
MNLHARLEWLNSLAPAAAEAELIKCCGSIEWVRRMTSARPFTSTHELGARADEIWWSLPHTDWLEAFRSHPKIGEKEAAHPVASDAQRWSEQEQSQTQNASEATMQSLRELNRAYEEQFGYIFIICATGKSPDELLNALRARLRHGPEKVIRCAAGEQAQITKLRLSKLIDAFEV